ncbi:hypothetical protein BH11CYA1_BH11CYA1_30850 [soil metagenome]
MKKRVIKLHLMGLPLARFALSSAICLTFQSTINMAPAFAQYEEQNGLILAQSQYRSATQMFSVGDYQNCVNLLRQAQTGDARNKQIPHLMALAYSQLGDSKTAEIQFRSALSLDYNFVECHNNYGILLKKISKFDDAKMQFKDCIRINPRYPKAHYNLGTVYFDQGDLDSAIESFRTATRLDPGYFEANRDLGLAIFQKFERGDGGEISESLEKLEVAAKLVPQNPMIHYHLANIFCCDGNLDEGEIEFRKALKFDPKLAVAHFELGRLRYLRGDPNRALFELKEAQKVSPIYTEGKKYPSIDRVKVKQLQAKCEELTDNYDAAIESLKDVASLTANNTQTTKHIAELSRLSRSGGHRSAKEVDPAEIKSIVSQGIHQTESGDLDGAKVSFNKAIELDPKAFTAFQNLGGILEAQGDLANATMQYQAALDLKPKYDGLYYNMAYLLEKENMKSEAGAWYKRFHELSGKYPYDPKHIVSLQQELARERVRDQSKKHN